MKRNCVIIAQGGAGDLDYLKRRKTGLTKAVKAGYELMKHGGSSLDAVEKATIILEDRKVFNAGTGSYLNLTGVVEMDAAIMTSRLEFGAVAAIKDVKNPITVARLVMEKTDHILLCDKGATKFARLMGIAKYDAKTKSRIRRWQRDRKLLRSKFLPRLKQMANIYGTVGVVAKDKEGLISVATSTGGMSMRLPGRVGDTPIIGAGSYANNYGGVSVTGHGEMIMKELIGYRAASLMRYNPAPIAARKVMRYASKKGCPCGLIGIDNKGKLCCIHNIEGMTWCYIRDGGMKTFNIKRI